MTAEVLIIRQKGVILASDKASTTPDNKSYTTSKKIFRVDDYPVGMMINGYIDFEGIFVGDLIEEFKKECDFEKKNRNTKKT